MMKLFGDNIICVDATHGTNVYDFQVISIVVVDEFGEGFPAAWCICNREDQIALQDFFKQVYSHVGEVKPKVFMSDDAEQYYSSWAHIFAGEPKKILCIWHVDRAWRKAIYKLHQE